MKKILSAAFAAMMLFSVPAFAQTSGNGQEITAGQNMKKMKKARKGDFKDFKDKKEGRCDSAFCKEDFTPRNEFEGMNLTETQKSQLQQLKDKRREEAKARKEAMKAEGQETKNEAKIDRKAMKEEREASRRQYLKDVKNIVGQENYVIFLENQFVEDSGRAPMQKEMSKGGPRMKMEAKGAKGSKGTYAKHEKKNKKGSKSGKSMKAGKGTDKN